MAQTLNEAQTECSSAWSERALWGRQVEGSNPFIPTETSELIKSRYRLVGSRVPTVQQGAVV